MLTQICNKCVTILTLLANITTLKMINLLIQSILFPTEFACAGLFAPFAICPEILCLVLRHDTRAEEVIPCPTSRGAERRDLAGTHQTSAPAVHAALTPQIARSQMLVFFAYVVLFVTQFACSGLLAFFKMCLEVSGKELTVRALLTTIARFQVHVFFIHMVLLMAKLALS